MRTTLGLSLVAVLIPLDPGYAATASANIVSATPVLGDGYSDIDGIARASCLSNVGKVIDPSGSGGTATVRLVTHTESLRKVLNLSASATFGIGIYSGSADANYVESTNLSKYNSVIIVRVSQNTGTERLGTPMRLSRDVPNPKKDPAGFYRRCGNSLITAADRGGAFNAFLRLDTDSSDHESALETKLSGGILNFGNANLTTSLHQIFSETNTRITYDAELRGAVTGYPNYTLDEVLKFAQNFPVLVSSPEQRPNNVYNAVEWKRYDSVLSSITPSESNVADYMENLADNFEGVSRAIADVTYVKEHPEQFSPKAADIIGSLGELDTAQKNIKKMAKSCATNIENCKGAIPSLPQGYRAPERVRWIRVESASSSWQTVGYVPPGEVRSIESRGTWYCGGAKDGKVCPQTGAYFQVIDANGVVVIPETGFGTSSPVKIAHAGQVRVRVADSYFDDNHNDPQNDFEVSVW